MQQRSGLPLAVISTTKTFGASGYRFTVETRSSELASAIDDVLRDVVDETTGEPEDSFLIEMNGTRASLTKGWSKTYFDSVDELLSELVSMINRAVLDRNSHVLHIHGGAVSKQGEMVLLVARSGAGKTTTTACLIQAGWQYHTDETVEVSPASTMVRSFPKPLSVKRAGFKLFQEIVGASQWSLPESGAPQVAVAATSVGASTCTAGEPRLIVLLDSSETRAGIADVASAADTVVALAEESMDLDRFGRGGLLLLARLAARCMRVKVARADVRDICEAVEREMSRGASAPLDVMSIDPSEYWPFEPVETVVVGSEAVVRNLSNGRLASLNEAATSKWIEFVRQPKAAPESVNAAFFQGLREAGIIVKS